MTTFGIPWRPIRTQVKAYTGTAAAVDNGFATGVQVIRVYCTTDAFIAIGKAPVATTSDIPMEAKKPEYFVVSAGEKVSAIQSASGGNVHVTECSR